MARSFLRRCCVALLFCMAAATVRAQDTTAKGARPYAVTPPGRVQLMVLRDGSALVGRVTAADSTTVHFVSSVGPLEVPVANIRSVENVEGEIHGDEYWPANPNRTRLLFGPTGRMLERGEGYFSDYYVFFPGVAVGLTDWLSLGGGVSLIPGIGLDQQIYFLTPKLRLVERGKVSAATGALIGFLPTDFSVSSVGTRQTFGVYYAAGTYGTADASVTAGLGYGFAGGTVRGDPVLMLGGEQRLSKHIGVVTENYLVSGSDTQLLSGGVRFFGSKLTVDLALFRPLGSGASGVGVGIPYVDFVFHF